MNFPRKTSFISQITILQIGQNDIIGTYPLWNLSNILFFYQQFVFISTWLIYCILCHVSHFIILMYTFLSGTLTRKFSACHSYDINWSHVRKLICSTWEIQTFALIEIFFELKMEIFKDNRNACLEARNIKRTLFWAKWKFMCNNHTVISLVVRNIYHVENLDLLSITKIEANTLGKLF